MIKSDNLARLISILAICTAAVPAAAAQITPTTTLDTDARLQAFGENNGSLGTASPNDSGSLAAEARFRLTHNINPNTLFYWEGRGVGIVGKGGFETSDTGALSSSISFLEMKQAYLEYGSHAGDSFYGRVGRQRMRDPYGVWWNSDFDALKVGYGSTVFNGFIAGGQNLASYNTSVGAFRNNDKALARLMAEGSWQYHYENFIETRIMALNDHSGVAPVGTVEAANDPNSADGHLFWYGARAAGKLHSPLSENADKVGYRLDLMAVSGRERTDTTVAGAPGSGLVTVAATNSQHVQGWGFDGGVDVPLPVAEAGKQPQIHLGYAYGSGDGNAADGNDHAFRQTGLDGNYSRPGALSQNAYNYGTVLRPQLSNVHIFSAGATKPVLEAADIGLMYRYYRLASVATSLPASGILNTLNGVDKDLGHGIDLLLNVDMMRQWNLTPGGINAIKFRSSLGAFRTGKAYGANDDKTVWRGIAEVQVSF